MVLEPSVQLINLTHEYQISLKQTISVLFSDKEKSLITQTTCDCILIFLISHHCWGKISCSTVPHNFSGQSNIFSMDRTLQLGLDHKYGSHSGQIFQCNPLDIVAVRLVIFATAIKFQAVPRRYLGVFQVHRNIVVSLLRLPWVAKPVGKMI